MKGQEREGQGQQLTSGGLREAVLPGGWRRAAESQTGSEHVAEEECFEVSLEVFSASQLCV